MFHFGARERREHVGCMAAFTGNIRRTVGWNHGDMPCRAGGRLLQGRRSHIGKRQTVGVALRAVAGDIDVIHRVKAVIARRRMTQRAIAIVRGRQRNVVGRQIGRAFEARRIEVASAAFTAGDVRLAVGLERRTHLRRGCARPQLARFVAGRTSGGGYETMHHGRR